MGMGRERKMKIFSGSAHPELARELCEYIGVPLGKATVSRFSNGEIQVVIDESVRGVDIFVVQPMATNVNEDLMELLILIDAFRRASARRITAVIPHYGYARQDRKARGREPISAKLVANLLTVAGASRILTMDLHAAQIQGFFDIPLDHLTGIPILAQHFLARCFDDGVVVAPDLGGVTRARDLAHRLHLPIAIIDKRRPAPNVTEVMNIIGSIEGRRVIMVDDMIDTAGTIEEGAEALLARGAMEVYACCTHPVLSGPAIERLKSPAIKEVVVTNTIPLPPEKRLDKIVTLSVAPIFGEAIVRIFEDLSVSQLF
ncbi:MAG TPA: ribose-phosphate pyrophosphokinase [Firmicutes bacterium]|nr:ribose-phosphate pyrophosphokinase [Bacillota bacterium]